MENEGFAVDGERSKTKNKMLAALFSEKLLFLPTRLVEIRSQSSRARARQPRHRTRRGRCVSAESSIPKLLGRVCVCDAIIFQRKTIFFFLATKKQKVPFLSSVVRKPSSTTGLRNEEREGFSLRASGKRRGSAAPQAHIRSGTVRLYSSPTRTQHFVPGGGRTSVAPPHPHFF